MRIEVIAQVELIYQLVGVISTRNDRYLIYPLRLCK